MNIPLIKALTRTQAFKIHFVGKMIFEKFEKRKDSLIASDYDRNIIKKFSPLIAHLSGKKSRKAQYTFLLISLHLYVQMVY